MKNTEVVRGCERLWELKDDLNCDNCIRQEGMQMDDRRYRRVMVSVLGCTDCNIRMMLGSRFVSVSGTTEELVVMKLCMVGDFLVMMK